MNITHTTPSTFHPLPLEKPSSPRSNPIVSLVKAPFIGIWKLCRLIFNVIFYPVKLIARLFTKSPQTSLPAPTLAPTFLNQLEEHCTRFKQQAIVYKKEISAATTLGAAALTSLYVYKNLAVTVPVPNNNTSIVLSTPAVTLLVLGGALTLAGCFAHKCRSVPIEEEEAGIQANANTDATETGTQANMNTGKETAKDSAAILMNEILKDLETHVNNQVMTTGGFDQEKYNQAYRDYRDTLPAVMDVKAYKTLLKGKKNYAPSAIKSKITKLINTAIFSTIFNENKAIYLQILQHLHALQALSAKKETTPTIPILETLKSLLDTLNSFIYDNQATLNLKNYSQLYRNVSITIPPNTVEEYRNLLANLSEVLPKPIQDQVELIKQVSAAEFAQNKDSCLKVLHHLAVLKTYGRAFLLNLT